MFRHKSFSIYSSSIGLSLDWQHLVWHAANRDTCKTERHVPIPGLAAFGLAYRANVQPRVGLIRLA